MTHQEGENQLRIVDPETFHLWTVNYLSNLADKQRASGTLMEMTCRAEETQGLFGLSVKPEPSGLTVAEFNGIGFVGMPQAMKALVSEVYGNHAVNDLSASLDMTVVGRRFIKLDLNSSDRTGVLDTYSEQIISEARITMPGDSSITPEERGKLIYVRVGLSPIEKLRGAIHRNDDAAISQAFQNLFSTNTFVRDVTLGEYLDLASLLQQNEDKAELTRLVIEEG